MMPTINVNAPNIFVEWDTVYINQFREYKRNDIVVANVNWNTEAVIKRLIGVPGDEIQILENGDLYELYVNKNLFYARNKNSNTTEYYNKYLTYLLDSENSKNVSSNSLGKCIKLNNNEYFLMGDNWEKSTDGISHGPITKSQIIGCVDLIVDHDKNETLVFINYFIKSLFN